MEDKAIKAIVEKNNIINLEPDTQFIHGIIQPLLDLFGNNLYVQASVSAILGLFAAWLLAIVLTGIVKRLAAKTVYSFDEKLVIIIQPPLFYTLTLIGFSIAIDILELTPDWHEMSVSILQSISILVWSVFIIRFIRLLMLSTASRPGKNGLISQHTLPLFQNLVSVIITIVAIYILFNTWGIDMSAWLASAGVLGIAIGFAAKDTLANFISGVFILADAPYKIRDYIVLDSGERGEVTHIGIRSTRIMTRDDVELTIPNSVMGNSKIINESGGPYLRYRIRIPVGVAYGSNIQQVRKILLEVAGNQEDIEKYPEPRVRFRLFGASSLDFELLCWVKDPRQRGYAIDQLLEGIYNSLNMYKVEIPYSKQDLYIKEWPKPNEE